MILSQLTRKVCSCHGIMQLYIYLGLEIPRDNIKILQQLGIGEYGPVYDAEIHLQVNVKSRALVKVCKNSLTL